MKNKAVKFQSERLDSEKNMKYEYVWQTRCLSKTLTRSIGLGIFPLQSYWYYKKGQILKHIQNEGTRARKEKSKY